MDTKQPFPSPEAEIIWWQSQVMDLQRRLHFVTELRRINGDVRESAHELTRLYRDANERLEERTTQLEVALAQVLASCWKEQRSGTFEMADVRTLEAIHSAQQVLGVNAPGLNKPESVLRERARQGAHD